MSTGAFTHGKIEKLSIEMLEKEKMTRIEDIQILRKYNFDKSTKNAIAFR